MREDFSISWIAEDSIRASAPMITWPGDETRGSISQSLRTDSDESRDRGNVQMRLQQSREAVVCPGASRVRIFLSHDVQWLKAFAFSNFVQKMPAEPGRVE